MKHRSYRTVRFPMQSSARRIGLRSDRAIRALRSLPFHAAAPLEQLGVYASATAPGKRGFRVYPSWVTGLHGQAKKSQDAQRPAFSVLVD